jgi:hypothetical protein
MAPTYKAFGRFGPVFHSYVVKEEVFISTLNNRYLLEATFQ